MTTEGKVSPLKLYNDGGSALWLDRGNGSWAPGDKLVAIVYGDNPECEEDDAMTERVAFIVRAVNAHDRLVAAVQRALDVEESVTQGVEKALRVGYKDILRAALAAAKGKV